MKKIYIKLNGQFQEYEDTVEMRQALHIDKQIAEQRGDTWEQFNSDDLPDKDKISLGIITEQELLKTKKEEAINNLSRSCKIERIKILDDTKIMNILSGATQGYPSYLTPANVAKFIEIYKQTYKVVKAQIDSVSSLKELDDVVEAVKFPTEEEIVSKLK
jgi:hypothetical protein